VSGVNPSAAIGAVDSGAPVLNRIGVEPAAAVGTQGPSFGEIMRAGLHDVDTKIAHADALAQQFALDDSVPVHQVTMALEEARLSVELAMQVRTRLVEGYRELMNMQL